MPGNNVNVTYYQIGAWKFCCYTCGRTDLKSDKAIKNWQGFWQCPLCWEQRNSQDLIRSVKDPQAPAWVQRCGPCCGCDEQGNTRVLDSPNLDEISLG